MTSDAEGGAGLGLERTLTNLVENERHFNTIQAGIRGLASTWVLAAFTGLAVLLQQAGDSRWIISPPVLAVIVCVMASVGVSALWTLDQVVYQGLLNASFLVGLRLERDFAHVPPIRSLMVVASRGRGMSRWFKAFYLLQSAVFCAVSLLSAWIGLGNPPPQGTRFVVSEPALILLAVLPVFPLLWILVVGEQVPFYRRAALLGLEGGNLEEYEKIVRRYTPRP